jgi:hypothetical protein
MRGTHSSFSPPSFYPPRTPFPPCQRALQRGGAEDAGSLSRFATPAEAVWHGEGAQQRAGKGLPTPAASSWPAKEGRDGSPALPVTSGLTAVAGSSRRMVVA